MRPRNTTNGRQGGDAGSVSVWSSRPCPWCCLPDWSGLIGWSGLAEAVRGSEYPPIEALTFQRVTLGDEGIVVRVLNDGPDPVTIAQVQVDDAYWDFSADPGRSSGTWTGQR